jgi:hypothetical protein
LQALLQRCWAWTAEVNGVGCDPDEEPSERAFGWNDAYFRTAAIAATSGGQAGIEELLGKVLALPDKGFFEAAEAVIHELDEQWHGGRVHQDLIRLVRQTIVDRLIATTAWRSLARERSTGTNMDLIGVLAALFFAVGVPGSAPREYTAPADMPRIEVLLPMLTGVAEVGATSLFVAMGFLQLLEIEPQRRHLPFMARAVAAWAGAQGTQSEFWLAHGIGSRACNWIDRAFPSIETPSDDPLRSDLTIIVDTLVRCGIPTAAEIERRLGS